MPEFCEKAVSISCCDAVSVGTGLEDGVGAGATKALRISSVVAIRMKSWSLTMQRLSHRRTPVENSELNFQNLIFGHFRLLLIWHFWILQFLQCSNKHFSSVGILTLYFQLGLWWTRERKPWWILGILHQQQLKNRQHKQTQSEKMSAART